MKKDIVDMTSSELNDHIVSEIRKGLRIQIFSFFMLCVCFISLRYNPDSWIDRVMTLFLVVSLSIGMASSYYLLGHYNESEPDLENSEGSNSEPN